MKYGHGSTAITRSSGKYNHGSTHGSIKYNHGSMKYNHGSTHGSIKYNHGSTHGSIKYNHGSMKYNHGSMKYNHGSLKYNHGSLKYNHGSTRGSMKYNHGSSANSRGFGSSIINAFSPTMYPTEALPPVFTAPPPTHYPTLFIKIPELPINFNSPSENGVAIPNMPISFQINQGSNGWANYNDTPVTKNAIVSVISKITNLDKNCVTNMRFVRASKFQRRLGIKENIIYFTYNITTPPLIINNNLYFVYYNITNKLTNSVIDNTFNQNLHKSGLNINITSIEISPYSIIYSSRNDIESTGNTKDNTLDNIIQIYVLISVLIFIAILSVGVYLFHKTRKPSKTYHQQEALNKIHSVVDVIPQINNLHHVSQRRLSCN
jgi:hypothetical protein